MNDTLCQRTKLGIQVKYLSYMKVDKYILKYTGTI